MGGPVGRAPLMPALGGAGVVGGGGGGGPGALTSGAVGGGASSSGALGAPLGALGAGGAGVRVGGVPFGVVGVEPSLSGRYKGEYTSMTQLAAACVNLGDIAYLIGLDTREIICLCRRVDVGSGGIAWQGMVETMQATGPEFDGIYAWDPISTAGDPTWGTPGNESTGGVDPAVGALRLNGFMPFKGLRRAVFSEWYLDTLPTTPATANSLLSGMLPAAAVSGDYYAGGIGYNTSTWRGVVSANGNPNSPGLSYSGVAGTPSVGNKIQLHFDAFKYSTTTDAAFYVGSWSQDNNSPGTPPNGAASGLDSGIDTFNFCVSKVNNWVARLIRFCVFPIYG